jgi:gamma-glutamyl:cysteine ligase YbdK (ATP-grasp superfamily)
MTLKQKKRINKMKTEAHKKHLEALAQKKKNIAEEQETYKAKRRAVQTKASELGLTLACEVLQGALRYNLTNDCGTAVYSGYTIERLFDEIC